MTTTHYRGMPARDAGPDDPEVLNAVLTEPDFADSVAKNLAHCVIANAIIRRSDVNRVNVGARTVYVIFATNPREWVRYQLTQRSAAKVRAFDENPDAVRASAPWIVGTEVEMRRPVGSARLGARPLARGSNKREGKRRNIRRQPTRDVSRGSDL